MSTTSLERIRRAGRLQESDVVPVIAASFRYVVYNGGALVSHAGNRCLIKRYVALKAARWRNDGWEVKLMLHDCAQWASGQLPRTGLKTF